MIESHSDSTIEQRILLLLGTTGQSTPDLYAALRNADVNVHCCANMAELTDEIARGAVAALLSAEAAGPAGVQRLRSILRDQAAWSDFPVLLLTDKRRAPLPRHQPETPTDQNILILERPISTRTIVSAVKLAARARQRQYAQRREQTDHARSRHSLRVHSSRLGERVRAQSRMLRLLRDVATAANFAESPEEALTFALAQLCEFNRWAFGHAFLADPNHPDVIVPAEAFYEDIPDRFREFRSATLKMRFPRGEGLPGRVLASGQPEWTHGLERALDPHRARLARDLGMALIAAFPVMVGPSVVGVLEILAAEHEDVSPELLEAMASIGTQLGRVVERDRAERTLRESYQLIDRISDTAPTMIRVFDVDNQHYTFINRQMSAFFGKTNEELLFSPFETFLDALHPDDVAQVQRAKAAVQRAGRLRPVSWQARMMNAAGDWRWVRTWSVMFSPLDDEVPNQILSISIDVTDEVAAEEKLRQTERLTSLGTLAAGIAHEINNPLASVVMTAQLLRKRQLDPNTDQMLADLIEDARRCGRIVRNVQRFARQEPSERKPVNINSVVRAAEELGRAETKRAGVQTHLELAEDLPVVLGDATELEQVLVNLIANAAHASQAGQQVLIRTALMGRSVRLTVHDEGRGMPPEVKRHAFDPFYTTRSREGGTGLGLSIAHGIIEDHGGTIQIASELGRGTTITIVLPTKT